MLILILYLCANKQHNPLKEGNAMRMILFDVTAALTWTQDAGTHSAISTRSVDCARFLPFLTNSWHEPVPTGCSQQRGTDCPWGQPSDLVR